MGAASSLLDENRSNYLKGQVDAKFNEFAPIYKKQYFLAYLSQIQDELEQHKQQHTQLLKQRKPLDPGTVLYEENMMVFEGGKKWKHRFVVVRANYVIECYASYKGFMKGYSPLHRLMPTGGTVLISEEKYMEMLDQCYSYTSNVKEDLVPPVENMPGQFPVYLRLPYRRDPYFCFYNENQQTEFISIMSDCIRHQNKDFLKKSTCEVKAFLKALQLYRQEKGQYELWDMLIGSDVRVLANLFMEDFMPYLETEMQPFLKSRKADRRKTYFATTEAAYFLVQEHLLTRLNALKEECKDLVKQQEALMRSNMDQITSSRAFLEGKLKAIVTEPATEHCTKHVQPYLPAVLEEVMGPISLGFTEARMLSEGMMEQLCEDFQDRDQGEELQQALFKMSTANLQSCYDKVSTLTDHIQELQQTFSYHVKGLQDSTELDIKQLMENVEYTYELLLRKALEDPSINFGTAIQKASSRVLKQFDYDSSTVRKKISEEALISITLPSIKKHLAPSFKEELPKFEQYIFADYSNFINVENVYEDILKQILEKEVRLVVDEAASKQKFNLFTDSKYNVSLSSLSSTPPSSPGYLKTVPNPRAAHPPSPLLANGLSAKRCSTNELEPETKGVVLSSPKMLETKKADASTPSTKLSQDLPSAVKTVCPEQSVDDVFVASETENTTVETRPETITTSMDSLSSPVSKVTAALQRAVTSKSTEEVNAAFPDANANEPSAASAVFSSCAVGEAVLTAPPAGEEDGVLPATRVEGWSEDPAPNKVISDVTKAESKYPIAVCLPIEKPKVSINTADVPADEVAKKPACNLQTTDPESQTSSPVEDIRPLDCVKEIRDLVVEVIEVEEVLQPAKGRNVQMFEAV